MFKKFACIAAMCALAPMGAAAQSTAPEAPVIVIQECAIAPPAGATEFERLVWNDVCLYGSASGEYGAEADEVCASAKPDAETLKRVQVSGDLLQRLISAPDMIALRPTPNVELSCIHVKGLNLRDRTLPGSLRITNSVLGWLTVENAVINGSLNLRDSTFTDGLYGDGLSVTRNFGATAATFGNVYLGDSKIDGYVNFGKAQISGTSDFVRAKIGKALFMREEAQFGAVKLQLAQIGGGLDLRGSTFTGEFEAFELKVEGSLLARKSTFEKGVSFQDALISGNSEFDESAVTGLLNFERAKIGNDLYLRQNATFNDIKLRATKISGSLDAGRATVTGEISAQSLFVRDNAYLREGTYFGDADFSGASIGEHLQLQGSTFHKQVNLTEAEIGSLLLWRDASSDSTVPAHDAYWERDAKLILRNAQAGALQARMLQSWQRADGTPLPIDINGFQYDKLGGYSSGAVHDLSQVDVRPMIAWVSSAQGQAGSGRVGYTPQPYRALQSAFERMGADSAAREVAYARLKHRAATRISARFLDDPWRWAKQASGMVWDRFLQVTVGFGVYPQIALFWFVGLVAIGTILVRRSDRLAERGVLDSLWYSLENAIPLIEPSDEHKIKHPNWKIRSFFHFQRVSGFILASVLIGAVTLGG